MVEFLLYAYVTAIGFCAAGLCASAWQMVTGAPLRFALGTQRTLPALLGVFARVLAGPVIVMRNALRAALAGGRAPSWLAVSTFISMVWSFFSGVVLLEAVLRLPPLP